MRGDFDSQEFIELANDMFEDGAVAELYRYGPAKFNPATLVVPRAPIRDAEFNLIWIAPQQSTTIRFDKELDSEDYVEHRVASVNYLGELNVLDRIHTSGIEYTVTGVAKTAPLGVTIYQRVKLSR